MKQPLCAIVSQVGGGGGGGFGQLEANTSICVICGSVAQQPKGVVLHGQLDPLLSVLAMAVLPQQPKAVVAHGQLDPG
jgi:hypothetical protein